MAGLWSHSCSGESGFAADTHQTSRPRLDISDPVCNRSAPPDDLLVDTPQINNDNDNSDDDRKYLQSKLKGIKDTKCMKASKQNRNV